MTISNSVKAQLFALYLGKMACVFPRFTPRKLVLKVPHYHFDDEQVSLLETINSPNSYLQLRSVSDLNQKEIEVIKYNILDLLISDGLDVRKNGDYVVYKQNNEVRYPSVENANIVHQYMRSIGIALPFTYLDENNHPITLSVEQLINLNWIKIKEK